MNAYITVFRRWKDFSGRSGRREYWMFFLINIIASTILGLLSAVAGIFALVKFIYDLVVLVPNLAVSVRRLHDLGYSGWWLVSPLVPGLVGGASLLASSGAPEGGGVSLRLFAFVFIGLMVLASLALLVAFMLKGNDGDNRYGPPQPID